MTCARRRRPSSSTVSPPEYGNWIVYGMLKLSPAGETELEGIGGEGRRSKTISKSLIRERHNILIATMASSPVDTAGATTRTRTLGPYVAVRPPRVELTRAPPRGTSSSDFCPNSCHGRAARFPLAPVVTGRRQQLQPRRQ